MWDCRRSRRSARWRVKNNRVSSSGWKKACSSKHVRFHEEITLGKKLAGSCWRMQAASSVHNENVLQSSLYVISSWCWHRLLLRQHTSYWNNAVHSKLEVSVAYVCTMTIMCVYTYFMLSLSVSYPTLMMSAVLFHHRLKHMPLGSHTTIDQSLWLNIPSWSCVKKGKWLTLRLSISICLSVSFPLQ